MVSKVERHEVGVVRQTGVDLASPCQPEQEESLLSFKL